MAFTGEIQDGEHLALDFLNTACGERLGSYGDLVGFLERSRAVNAMEAALLDAAASVEGAQEAFRRALALRDVLGTIVTARVSRRPLAPADLEHVNWALASLPHAVLVESHGGYALRHAPLDGEPAGVMIPLVEAVADLLVQGRWERVRACRGDRCSCWFTDTSRNGARVWCSMKACGNRAKASTYYRRGRPTTADDAAAPRGARIAGSVTRPHSRARQPEQSAGKPKS